MLLELYHENGNCKVVNIYQKWYLLISEIRQNMVYLHKCCGEKLYQSIMKLGWNQDVTDLVKVLC